MMITIKIRVFRIVIGFYARLKKVNNLIFFTMILQNFVMWRIIFGMKGVE